MHDHALYMNSTKVCFTATRSSATTCSVLLYTEILIGRKPNKVIFVLPLQHTAALPVPHWDSNPDPIICSYEVTLFYTTLQFTINIGRKSSKVFYALYQLSYPSKSTYHITLFDGGHAFQRTCRVNYQMSSTGTRLIFL